MTKKGTTFRTSKGVVVSVTYPDIYIQPGYVLPADVTSPAEMREVLREELLKFRGWKEVFRLTDVGEMAQTAVAPNGDIYVGSGYGSQLARVYRSRDGGLTWVLVWDKPANEQIVTDIKVARNGYVFICTGFANVYRSTDGGNTWTQVSTFTDNASSHAHRMAIAPNGDLYVGTLLAAALRACTVYRSTDYGTTWNLVYTAATANEYEVEEVVVTSLGTVLISIYTSGGGTRVYRSPNSGVTWTLVWDGTALGFSAGRIFASKQGYIYVCPSTGREIYRSDDDGVTFTKVYEFPTQIAPIGGQFNRMAEDRNGYLYMIFNVVVAGTFTHLRIFESTDNGLHWSMVFYAPDQNGDDVDITEDGGVICVTREKGGGVDQLCRVYIGRKDLSAYVRHIVGYEPRVETPQNAVALTVSGGLTPSNTSTPVCVTQTKSLLLTIFNAGPSTDVDAEIYTSYDGLIWDTTAYASILAVGNGERRTEPVTVGMMWVRVRVVNKDAANTAMVTTKLTVKE